MSETRERSALDLLRELEWAGTPIHAAQADGAPVSFGRCHFCRRNEEGGHAPDCALDAVLRSTPASDGGEVRERVGEALKQFDDIRWADVIAALPADLVMWTWKYLRYVRSDLVAALELLGVEVEEGDPLASIPAAILSASGTPQGEGEALYDGIMAIHDYAHDHSTGPAVPDALWTIREMAADLLAELRAAPVPAREGEEDPVEVDPQWIEWAGDIRDVVDGLQACVRALEGRDGADVLTELARARGVIGRIEPEIAARLRGEGGGS